MTSREQILSKVKKNQLALATPLPSLDFSFLNEEMEPQEIITGFGTVLQSIGGQVLAVDSYADILHHLGEQYNDSHRIISTIPELESIAEQNWQSTKAHLLENVDLVVIKAEFGVAENAALWITEELMGQRVAPFIGQQLAVVLSRKNLVPTMSHAYRLIGEADYGFATFIAGPSKTADIEQSLVLGAHGPKGMMVFLLP